jgi:hypothetical protein
MKSFQLNTSTFMATSGTGVNIVFPVNAPNGMTILGYTGSIAMAFPGKTTGFYEVLLIGAWFPAGPAPTWQNTPPSAINIPPNSDIGTPTLGGAPSCVADTVAATGGGNTFVSAILKANAPDAANLPLGAMGLSIRVPHGGYIVLHLDGDGVAGQDPGNAELQLTVFYE